MDKNQEIKLMVDAALKPKEPQIIGKDIDEDLEEEVKNETNKKRS